MEGHSGLSISMVPAESPEYPEYAEYAECAEESAQLSSVQSVSQFSCLFVKKQQPLRIVRGAEDSEARAGHRGCVEDADCA